MELKEIYSKNVCGKFWKIVILNNTHLNNQWAKKESKMKLESMKALKIQYEKAVGYRQSVGWRENYRTNHLN